MKSLVAVMALGISVSFLSAAEPAPVSPPTSTQGRALELVRDLGDARFKTRANAMVELRKMGRFAMAAIQEGTKSSDPEVWSRCKQLLPEILAIDLKARVDAYLADTEGKQKHDLPLMELFKKVAGSDASARKLYADIVRSNANFLETCAQDPSMAGEKYNLRAHEMQQQLWGPWSGTTPRPQLSAADLAALFLVGADAEMSKGITVNNVNPVSNFLWQPQFQNALKTGEQASAYRKVFFAWAEQRGDINSINQALSVVQNINLKEGIDFAIKVMKMKNQQVNSRAQAMTVVGKMGSKDNIAAFESLFDDKTLVVNIQFNNLQLQTQINDIALAMAAQLSGQQPKDYGFEALQTQPSLIFAYHYLGFTSDEKRAASFKKWNDWVAAQKKK